MSQGVYDATNVVEFKENAMKSLSDHDKGIILNFVSTVFIDSAGLGALVSILKVASHQTRKLLWPLSRLKFIRYSSLLNCTGYLISVTR
jgi:hypothetical protein